LRLADAESRRPEDERIRAGLCADCRSARRVPSSHGTTFYRCMKADVDPRFVRYPRLPVLDCAGYEREVS
jgi:hypothetical protein